MDRGVLVPMMQIGIMRVLVPDRKMVVPMSMRLASGIAGRVHMLMVGIMEMPMLVLQSLMFMLVLVRFREVQIEAGRHQDPRADQASRDLFSEHGNCQDCADKRRCREVRACSRRSQVAQA